MQPAGSDRYRSLARARDELLTGLIEGILPFWRARALDRKAGGYFTEFDGEGRLVPGKHDKYLVTQTRLLWCFSTLASVTDDPKSDLELARHGMDFLVDRFLDPVYGGWRWRTSHAGEPIDDAKLVFGQSFALYAIATYARTSGDDRARRLAGATFDLLHRNAADTIRGGYYENLDRNWRPAATGSAAGDRKSLDIHMHLLEAFTELVRLTSDAVHARRLREVREVICTRMVDAVTGAGGSQYSLEFRPLQPIAIDRTWVAERPKAGSGLPTPVNLTSYGHNLELAWLLAEADTALGESGESDPTISALARHALQRGYDSINGGVYREGPADGEASDRDKEFWQNSEALVGFLEAFRVTGEEAFLDAFLGTWSFARAHLVHPKFGEWRIRTTEDGEVVVGDLGNAWKNAYHTGRAALESVRRLEAILGGTPEPAEYLSGDRSSS